MPGLSPHTRGNPRYSKGSMRNSELPGSIPAHAGEPALRITLRDVPTMVYPRTRGGTTATDPAAIRLWGSIPAHAGEPGSCRSFQFLSRVYPRTRGGTEVADFALTDHVQGLSPHTRGNRLRHPRREVTPRVYPRTRGGTPTPSALPALRLPGSIPAHAGEPEGSIQTHSWCLSPHTRGNHGSTGVYPRTRGGTDGFRRSCDPLPMNRRRVYPRTRGGTQPASDVLPRRINHGSIPAHAGEPAGLQRRAVTGSIPAHAGEPGGTSTGRADSSQASGSIPAHAGEPVRGLVVTDPRTPRGNLPAFGPRRVPASLWGGGSIPAHAGEPLIINLLISKMDR